MAYAIYLAIVAGLFAVYAFIVRRIANGLLDEHREKQVEQFGDETPFPEVFLIHLFFFALLPIATLLLSMAAYLLSRSGSTEDPVVGASLFGIPAALLILLQILVQPRVIRRFVNEKLGVDEEGEPVEDQADTFTMQFILLVVPLIPMVLGWILSLMIGGSDSDASDLSMLIGGTALLTLSLLIQMGLLRFRPLTEPRQFVSHLSGLLLATVLAVAGFVVAYLGIA